jgi:hypothetical protein
MADGNVAADQLRLFIERIERLHEERRGIADDIRDVFAEAKANGYDVPKMKRGPAPAGNGNPHPAGSATPCSKPIVRRSDLASAAPRVQVQAQARTRGRSPAPSPNRRRRSSVRANATIAATSARSRPLATAVS